MKLTVVGLIRIYIFLKVMQCTCILRCILTFAPTSLLIPFHPYDDLSSVGMNRNTRMIKIGQSK